MSRTLGFWSLPGPFALLEQCEEVLREGSSLVLRFPLRVPERLAAQLRTRTEEFLAWTPVAPRAEPEPERQICATLHAPPPGIRSPSVYDLFALPEFAGHLFFAEIDKAEVWETWRGFLDRFADASRSVPIIERSLVVVALCGAPVRVDAPAGVALKTLDFRGIVDEIDLLLLAHQRLRARRLPRRGRALLSGTIARLGMSDLELVDRLIEEPTERVLEPWPVLMELARERGWNDHTERSWAYGTVDAYEGEDQVQSALLAGCGESRTLARRLWAAQAAVLLPVIEQGRASLVRKVRGRLRFPIQTAHGEIADPQDLELAHLAYQIDRPGTESRLRRSVRRLRRARNHLAHLEPLEANQAIAILTDGSV